MWGGQAKVKAVQANTPLGMTQGGGWDQEAWVF